MAKHPSQKDLQRRQQQRAPGRDQPGDILIRDDPPRAPQTQVKIEFPEVVSVRVLLGDIDPAVHDQMARILKTMQVAVREVVNDPGVRGLLNDLPPSARDSLEGFDRLDLGDVQPLDPPPPPAQPSELDGLPGLRRLDQAISLLRGLNPTIRPGTAPDITRTAQFRVRVRNAQPADVALPVKISARHDITSRFNLPTARDRSLGATFIENQEIPLTGVHGAFPRLYGDKSFALPDSYVLNGQFNFSGNYGQCLLRAEFTDARAHPSHDYAVLELSGPFEEEERARENARFQNEARLLRGYNAAIGAIRAVLNLAAIAIDMFASLGDVVPVIGGLIALTWRTAKNLISALSNALLGIWSVLQEVWQQQNETLRSQNLALAEQLPESGRPGEREVLR